MTYAKIIADSVSREGHRLVTMEVQFHRFVLAEFNTHRVFSRNSASSRAIPLAKQLEKVRTSPAKPVVWASEQQGMSGGDEVDGVVEADYNWIAASECAVAYAQNLGQQGVHKSIANRLLEPFMQHTVVVTSVAWQNFFALRCNPMAQPEIRVAAEMMAKAYADSTPELVEAGQWHTPYLDAQDEKPHMTTDLQVKVSAARCARVSYLTQNGVRDFEQDVQLYDRLIGASPMHASPLEHVARPAPGNAHIVFTEAGERFPTGLALTLPRYGNLLGWHQHRFDVEAEKGYRAFA